MTDIMAGRNIDLKFEIINQIGVISISASGWNVELNRVSWNRNEPKYDVRSLSPNRAKTGKGIALSEEKPVALSELLAKEVEFLKED